MRTQHHRLPPRKQELNVYQDLEPTLPQSMSMGTPETNGVISHETRWHPYQSPDIELAHFDPSGFMITNAIPGIKVDATAEPDSNHESRLGVANVGRRTITVSIELVVQRGNLPTLAASDNVVLSLEHGDDRRDMARAGLFTRIEAQNGFLNFSQLYQQACMGPEGDRGMDIQIVLGDLAKAAPNRQPLLSHFRSWSSVKRAYEIIDKAISPGPVVVRPGLSFHEAWREFVEKTRRPAFQKAELELQRADQTIENFAADLKRHAKMEDLCEVHLITLPFSWLSWKLTSHSASQLSTPESSNSASSLRHTYKAFGSSLLVLKGPRAWIAELWFSHICLITARGVCNLALIDTWTRMGL